MATNRRILKELQDMARDTSSGTEATPINPSDMTHLKGRFKGPPDTPYAGGEYEVDIKLPDNYPFAPPKMKFDTKVWHPNVSSQTGAICLDTLSAKWTPVLTIKTALLSLQSLLSAPEPSDPQDAEVANMMLNNPVEFKRKAKEWAIRYAGAPGSMSSSAAGKPLSPEDRRRMEREREYEGFDEAVVEKFTPMGFSVKGVVAALRAENIRPGQKLDDEATTKIVERLLS